jgi:hypothetical protein
MKCPRQHDMIEINPSLRLCECSASGAGVHRLGEVDDARRLIDRAGGFDALCQRHAHEHAEAQKAATAQRQRLLIAWHRQGTYSAQTFKMMPGSETKP